MSDFHPGTVTLDSPLISELLYHVIWEERRDRITIRGSWLRQVLQEIIILFWLILFFTAALQLCMTGIQIIRHTAFIATFWVIVRRSIRNHWSIDAKVMCASWTGFCYSTISSIFLGKCMSICAYMCMSLWKRERERYIEKKRDRETLHVKALHFDLRNSGWRWPIDSKFPTHDRFKIQLCVNTARMMASHGIWCFLCICSKAPQHYGSLCIAKAL